MGMIRRRINVSSDQEGPPMIDKARSVLPLRGSNSKAMDSRMKCVVLHCCSTVQKAWQVSHVWTIAMALVELAMLQAEGSDAKVACSSLLVTTYGLVSYQILCNKERSPPISIGFALIQLMLLFGVTVWKRCAQVGGLPINEEAALALFLLTEDEMKNQFGTFFSFKQFLPELIQLLFYALLMSLVIVVVLTTLCGMKHRERVRRAFLLSLWVATALLFSWLAWDRLHSLHRLLFSASECFDVPTHRMTRKMSMIFVVIDSLRSDMFTEHFGGTLQALGGQGHSCTEWKQHDSGTVMSDQAYLSLLYGMTPPTQDSFNLHFPRIKSWPIALLQSNGYHTHRIGTYPAYFCWITMQNCDLYFRDFDDTTKYDFDGSDEKVIDEAARWIELHRSESPNVPFFLMLDQQGTHFPYLSKKEHFKPALSEKETYDLIGDKIPENKTRDGVKTRLINRYRNSLVDVDALLAPFIRDVARPLLAENSLLVVTGDHATLLMDGKSNFVSHNVPTLDDRQRRVPLMICGPNDVIFDLKVPASQLTAHVDVFPSLLEAAGVKLKDGDLPGQSYFQFSNSSASSSSAGGILEGGYVYAAYPFNAMQLVKTNKVRVEAKKTEIKKIESAKGYNLTERDLEVLKKILRTGIDCKWPGEKQDCEKPSSLSSTVEDNPYGVLDDDLVDVDQRDHSSALSLGVNSTAFVADMFHQMTLNTGIINGDRRLEGGNSITIDVLVNGARTRPDLLKTQVKTWASHISIRSVVGMTERDNRNPVRSNWTADDVNRHIASCVQQERSRKSVQRFIAYGYGKTEGPAMYKPKLETRPGWFCAQQRVAQGLAYKGAEYRNMILGKGKKDSLPDYLVVVDDDTIFNVHLFEERVKTEDPSVARVYAGCMFEQSGYIRWNFPYGGFSTVFSRGAIERMIEPIHCEDHGSAFSKKVCSIIRLDRIGERKVFREGMSISDLFSAYSARDDFCMHSDWLLGYIVHFYGLAERDAVNEFDEVSPRLHHFAIWPEQCGNNTLAPKCNVSTAACHSQGKEAMESYTGYWRSRYPERYHDAEIDFGVLGEMTNEEDESSNNYEYINLEEFSDNPNSGIGVLDQSQLPLEQRILMVTFIFGAKTANSSFIPLFLASAQASGLDVVIVGSPAPPPPLPPNVRHVQITWEQLVARVSTRVFDGRKLLKLLKAGPYKVNDLKPLFAYLFPEEVQGYGWWGHLDNDILLGDTRRFLTPNMLATYDVISPGSSTQERTSGPFTLYRNSNMTNELFLRAPQALEELIDTTENVFFDEWGQNHRYSSSMSGIIETHGDRLGLEWFGGLPFSWDGACLKKENKSRCAGCSLVMPSAGGQRQKLVDEKSLREILFFHFQLGKKNVDAQLAKDPELVARLINDGRFRYSYLEGFSQSELPAEQRIVMAAFAFGEKYSNAPWLPLFIESARASGLDVMLVGSPAPRFPLPPNVRHVQITWEQLVARVSTRVFDGRKLLKLLKASPYKVNDLKPLFAYLFPDEVQGYGWWGYMDIDILLGDTRRFLSPKMLATYDVISPGSRKQQRTNGAFTLFRNRNYTNELFRRAARPLEELFDTIESMSFDEWGQGCNNTYSSSISGIIDAELHQFKLEWFGGLPFSWDGFCDHKDATHCAECALAMPSGGGKRQNLTEVGRERQILYCNFMNGKRILDAQLARDPELADRLIEEGRLRLSYPEGLAPFPPAKST